MAKGSRLEDQDPRERERKYYYLDDQIDSFFNSCMEQLAHSAPYLAHTGPNDCQIVQDRIIVLLPLSPHEHEVSCFIFGS
jgi:hypothetical protein